MPILHEFFSTHCRHHEYLTEITICDKSDCKVCPQLGRGVRTPATTDGLLRDGILRPMDRPVADSGNAGHFVPPEKTRAKILNDKLTFKQLKDQLPSLDSHPWDTELTKKCAAADKEAGGSNLFKHDKVRDVVECVNCNKPRCIFSMYTVRNKNFNLSKGEQLERLAAIEVFKDEDFTCGMACPVDGFHVKQSIRCGEFIESQYYMFAVSEKGRKKASVNLCCLCMNDENLASVAQIKDKLSLGGKTPLPLCKHCLDRNITPPSVNTTTNFFEKDKEARAKKKRRLESLVGKGLRKGRGAPKKK